MITRLFAVALAIPSAVYAFDSAPEPSDVLAVATLLDHDGVEPGGKIRVAVKLTIDSRFHINANPPSENLVATVLKWNSAQWLAGEPQVTYPPGELTALTALGPDVKSLLYEYEVSIVTVLQLSAEAKVGVQALTGEVRFQACDDQVCYFPMKLPVTVSIPVVAYGTKVTEANQSAFTESAVPGVAPSAAEGGPRVLGLLLTNSSYVAAIVICLLAGLILNIMPCVLPVIPLKVLSFFEQAKKSRWTCFTLGLAFSVGIVLFFFLLGLLMIPLDFGWGEQFQNPYFVWAMVLLMVVIAAAMFNVYAITLPGAVSSLGVVREGHAGALGMGFVAAILSTPCSAPLLGPAVGFALAQPPLLRVAYFVTVGLGMALPYTLLTAFPELLRWVPRAGRWTEMLRQGMGFVLLLVAAWLISLPLGPTVGSIVGKIAALVVTLSFCVWLIFSAVGARPTPGRRIAVSAISVIVLASMIAFLWWPRYRWEDYSAAALQRHQHQGEVVLVEFTANWCFSCKALESTVFGNKEVRKAVKQQRIILLKADLTLQNPEAEALMEQLGRNGIPITAIFVPGQDDPVLMPVFYSAGRLLETLVGIESSRARAHSLPAADAPTTVLPR